MRNFNVLSMYGIYLILGNYFLFFLYLAMYNYKFSVWSYIHYYNNNIIYAYRFKIITIGINS